MRTAQAPALPESFLKRWWARWKRDDAWEAPRDFTTNWRVVPISLIAIVVGVVGAFVAVVLLRLINLFTNLFFYGRWSQEVTSPAGNHLGPWIIAIPVIGALIVGVMARYGSEKIRGHGIPEALEAILLWGSRIEPRVAVLKPVSTAISIGSGGPFGAEGPIIMTGGAFGSLVAQLLRMSSSERKTLLAAGAAAGMSATFDAPVSSVLLAVELLLFESKPRSLIPVAFSSATAAVLRHYLLGAGPLFPVPEHLAFAGASALLGCAIAGVISGAAAMLLTLMVYRSEDAFSKLPIHWMWWPAIGGLVIGIGGWIFPEALGVGYDNIAWLMQGGTALHMIYGILIVKSLIWAISLGSGTSGGVLAPLLMIGGSLGALEAGFLPVVGAGFWPLVSMAAVLGGGLRLPFTAVVFCLEVTHDLSALLPLLIAVTVAYGFTVLTMPRSILTEKIARRGYHLRAESEADPLERFFVRDVMRSNVLALPADLLVDHVASTLKTDIQHGQGLYPVVDADHRLVGVLTRKDVRHAVNSSSPEKPLDRTMTVAQLAHPDPASVYPDELLRPVAYRMALTGFTRMLVVDRADPKRLVGILSWSDLLQGRLRRYEDENTRERVLPIRLFTPSRQRPANPQK